ncbi:MAG: hypothetical protein AAF705_04265 [Bacteroidota bacterium]
MNFKKFFLGLIACVSGAVMLDALFMGPILYFTPSNENALIGKGYLIAFILSSWVFVLTFKYLLNSSQPKSKASEFV